jgi:hypothetical protein
MRRQLVVAAAVVVMSACHLFPESSCPAGTEQCSNNVLQSCYADQMLGGAYWHNLQSCPPSQVCRLADASLDVREHGCYDPNAYCHAGSGECSGSLLWSCQLQPSDQTLRWAKTDCSAQVPVAACVQQYVGTTTTAACYEIVQNCPAADSHCEGNVLFTCSALPNVIDSKAVFDWITLDCALNAQVCRVNATSGPGCYASSS